jgi:hypothetical protein
MKAAAETPEGEIVFYEYLEGLITSPQTHEKGPRLNAETKKVYRHGTAQDKMPKGRETAKRTGYELMKEQVNQRLKEIA